MVTTNTNISKNLDVQDAESSKQDKATQAPDYSDLPSEVIKFYNLTLQKANLEFWHELHQDIIKNDAKKNATGLHKLSVEFEKALDDFYKNRTTTLGYLLAGAFYLLTLPLRLVLGLLAIPNEIYDANKAEKELKAVAVQKEEPEKGVDSDEQGLEATSVPSDNLAVTSAEEGVGLNKDQILLSHK